MKQITLNIALWLFAISLSTPLAAANTFLTPANTVDALEEALGDVDRLPPAERFVIVNQLRLRLAAVHMQAQDFESARNTLRVIDTDSPAALQASLLMAESYRLTGEPTEARKWFLRTAKHYPYRTTTLSGLISAAHDAQETNAGLSVALYAEIGRQSRFALDQLDAYQNRGELDPLAIIFPSQLDDAVRKTLLQRSLRHPEHNLLAQTGQLKQAVSAIIELRQRHSILDRELSGLHDTLAQYQQERQVIIHQLSTDDAQLATLMEQLVPNDLGEEQTRIRQQITRIRNQQTRLRAKLAFIERSQQAIPVIAQKLETQLQELHKNAQEKLQSSHNSVSEILQDAVAQYRAELSNIAAEAQLQRSELMLSSK